MKKLFFMLLSLPMFVTAQEKAGIDFQSSKNWEATLNMAKLQGKLIFIDIYTDWCGPCKTMDQEVFPMPKVGELFNASFVNYKLDAEKGEGIALAKRYKVTAYPTYLFVNGNGELVYRFGGSRSPEDFIVEGKNALLEAKQTQSLLQMEALYPAKKKDTAFMYAYVSRLTNLKQPTAELLDEYVGLLDQASQSDPKNIRLIVANGTFTNRKLALGKAFDVLMANKLVFEDLLKNKVIKQVSLRSIQDGAMQNSLNLAIKQKNTALYQKVRGLTADFKQNKFENTFTLDLEYYSGIKEYTPYQKVADHFVQQYLLKIPADTLGKMDKEVYNNMKVYYEKLNNPKIKIEEEIFQYKRTQTIQLSNLLYHISEDILNGKPNAAALQSANEYALKAVQIAETDLAYFQNVMPTYQKGYAVSQYKLGNKTLAISIMEKLLVALPGDFRESKKEEWRNLLTQMKTNKSI